LRVGFPHSEILGSAPICRLPEAYRRLSRPSSPVIAKASTSCTYSLDPITLPPVARRLRHKASLSALVRHLRPFQYASTTMQYITQCAPAHQQVRPQPTMPPAHNLLLPELLKISRLPTSRRSQKRTKAPPSLSSTLLPRPPHSAGGANRDRTGDLLLAKQALSQLSYGPVTPCPLCRSLPPHAPAVGEWWVWMDLNHRPHAYQACALTN
jgi:hypothetical protein